MVCRRGAYASMKRRQKELRRARAPRRQRSTDEYPSGSRIFELPRASRRLGSEDGPDRLWIAHPRSERRQIDHDVCLPRRHQFMSSTDGAPEQRLEPVGSGVRAAGTWPYHNAPPLLGEVPTRQPAVATECGYRDAPGRSARAAVCLSFHSRGCRRGTASRACALGRARESLKCSSGVAWGESRTSAGRLVVADVSRTP